MQTQTAWSTWNTYVLSFTTTIGSTTIYTRSGEVNHCCEKGKIYSTICI